MNTHPGVEFVLDKLESCNLGGMRNVDNMLADRTLSHGCIFVETQAEHEELSLAVPRGTTIQHPKPSHRSPNDGMMTQMVFPAISGCFARSSAAWVVITWVWKQPKTLYFASVRTRPHCVHGYGGHYITALIRPQSPSNNGGAGRTFCLAWRPPIFPYSDQPPCCFVLACLACLDVFIFGRRPKASLKFDVRSPGQCERRRFHRMKSVPLECQRSTATTADTRYGSSINRNDQQNISEQVVANETALRS